MSYRNAILLTATLLFAVDATPCQRMSPVVPEDLVAQADLIVRATAISDADRAIRFRVDEVVKGQHAPTEIELPGSFVANDDFHHTPLLRNDAAGTREEKNLADEAFFAETMRLAPALGAELGIDVVSAVALQSSEVQAVNAALNAGAQAEDLVASLPVVTWEDGIDNAPKPPRWKFWA